MRLVHAKELHNERMAKTAEHLPFFGEVLQERQALLRIHVVFDKDVVYSLDGYWRASPVSGKHHTIPTVTQLVIDEESQVFNEHVFVDLDRTTRVGSGGLRALPTSPHLGRRCLSGSLPSPKRPTGPNAQTPQALGMARKSPLHLQTFL